MDTKILYTLLVAVACLLPTAGTAQETRAEGADIAAASLAWRQDTLGMKGHRGKLMRKIGLMIGKTTREVEALLGAPDQRDKARGDTFFIYFYESHLYRNDSGKTASQIKRDFDRGRDLEGVTLGAKVILHFDRKRRLIDINFISNCG